MKVKRLPVEDPTEIKRALLSRTPFTWSSVLTDEGRPEISLLVGRTISQIFEAGGVGQLYHLLCLAWTPLALNSLTAANTQALLGRDQTAVGRHKGPPRQGPTRNLTPFTGISHATLPFDALIGHFQGSGLRPSRLAGSSL
ncbi:hypothetical protein AOLI_G00069610 [Acnodon oligacanthus]